MNFSLLQLEALVIAADTGSFSAAARQLGKAHSAVSTAISNLELDLNVELFDRSARSPKLTPQGEQLYAEAKLILGRCQYLNELASSANLEQEAQFVFAIDDQIGIPGEKALLAELGESFPELQLSIREGLAPDVVAMVTKGDADIALISQQQTISSLLQSQRLTQFDLRFICAPNHPLATLKQITRADLQMHRQVILDRGQRYSSEQLAPKVWKVDTLSGAFAVAESGQAWLMTPSSYVQDGLESGRFVELSVPSTLHRQYDALLVWRADKQMGVIHNQIRKWFGNRYGC